MTLSDAAPMQLEQENSECLELIAKHLAIAANAMLTASRNVLSMKGYSVPGLHDDIVELFDGSNAAE